MPIETAEALVQALRDSGLFTPEQLMALVREVAPLGDDLAAVSRHLVGRGRVTSYQLRKVMRGRAEELFVGPYLITDKVGEGGMGRVYRARKGGRRGPEVALKVVRPTLLANPVIRGRYAREVEAAGTLRHPNLVRVEDAGEAGGKHYLAMEFVDGVDLARLMRDYPQLEVEEACEYARQAAVGLHHAHRAGFVHRDIKPSNVIVAGERHVPQATEPARVKVLDMGLVRAVGGDDAGEDLTRTGTVIGTPDFMSPEQAKNSSAVDHRADLYSLGCTLYFLLTGRPPFAGGEAIEKLLRHQLDPPPPLQDLRPEVTDELAAVVARLMAKKPDDRHPDAAAVAEVLAPLARYPTGARPVPIRRRGALARPAGDSPPTPSRPGSAVTTPPPSAQPTRAAGRPGPAPAADHTPRPLGLPEPVPGGSPFDALDGPPSDPDEARRAPGFSRPAVPRPALLAALVGAVLALAAGVWLLNRPAKEPPAPPAGGGGEGPPKPPPPPSPRHRPVLTLVPDGSALVVVAHPAAYLRDQASPFLAGPGPAKLDDWAVRVERETALPLRRADRVVVTAPAAAPGQYLVAAEGDFLTRKFADDLSRNFATFQTVNTPEPGLKLYATGARQVGVYTSQSATPVYAVGNAPGLVEKLAPRLTAPRVGPSEVSERVLAALAPAAPGTPPPLLLAVAGGEWKPPVANPPALREVGIELLTLRARVAGERLEIDVAATGPDEKALREGLALLADRFRVQYPGWGPAAADLLHRADAPGGPADKDTAYRVTLRTTWNPDQWSDVLEKFLGP